MNSRVTHAAAIMACLLTAGCLSGREPPGVTRMLSVPGGTFTLGSAGLKCGALTAAEIERCDTNPKPKEPLAALDLLTRVPLATVTALPDFQMDEHEVTNLQYAYCVALGSCSPPGSDEVLGQPYYQEPGYEDRPVVNVTRQQARDYCIFVGRDLPSEAQWERAARYASVLDQYRTYPWGGEVPSSCVKGSKTYTVALGCSDLPLPVGYSQADRTALGVRNMASNVAEWVLDSWHRYAFCKGRKGYSQACQLQGAACADCVKHATACARGCNGAPAICEQGNYTGPAGAGAGASGVIRGGSFRRGICDHRLFARREGLGASPSVGFRCAR